MLKPPASDEQRVTNQNDRPKPLEAKSTPS